MPISERILKMNKTIDSHGVEFGYELQLMLPYCYDLHMRGYNVTVLTSPGMEPFYFFLPPNNIVIKHMKRRWTKSGSADTPNTQPHVHSLNTKEWQMPDFKARYGCFDLKTNFNKPLLLISNKYQEEWGHSPCNYIDLDTLLYIFTVLSEKFCIIYNRPCSGNITEDNSTMYNLNDAQLVDQFSDVYDINQIHEDEDMTFNQLQLVLLSKCRHKISVQGGNAVLCSLTGGTNAIYAVKGHELKCNSYQNWYSMFSDCQITHIKDYASIIRHADDIIKLQVIES